MHLERIVVVMPNWFGEVLFATPFLGALRAAYPQAFIAALGVPRSQEVLANNPHLDEFLLYDERGLHRALWAKRILMTTLRSRRVETAFILRRSLERTMLLVLAGIRRRIGFDNLKSGWLLTERVQAPPASTHKASSYLWLLEPLGVVEHRTTYRYYPSEEERAQALVLLRKHGLPEGKPLIVLHPGANWSHKRWPADCFAQLADRLSRQHACSIVMTGSPDDRPLVQAIGERMAVPPCPLVGQTTLRQLAACLERADLVVSNDTGPLHIASALGRPVVALYGPTSPAITGPLGDPTRTRVIHHDDCCPTIPCFQPKHPRYPGMNAITVDEVYEAANHLLHATH